MNEGFDLTNDDSAAHDVDSMARTHSVLPEDHLATTRLPPISPPPMRGPGGSQPPPSMLPQRQPRTSWWQALLTATFPPTPAPSAPTDERVVSRRIGLACGALSLVLLVIALGVGFRGVPSPFSSSPTVVAALVLARALMALGVLAFGYALLGIGERFFNAGRRDADRQTHRADGSL
jgi:hypothetical protein